MTANTVGTGITVSTRDTALLQRRCRKPITTWKTDRHQETVTLFPASHDFSCCNATQLAEEITFSQLLQGSIKKANIGNLKMKAGKVEAFLNSKALLQS